MKYLLLILFVLGLVKHVAHQYPILFQLAMLAIVLYVVSRSPMIAFMSANSYNKCNRFIRRIL
jgi:hypothetical protein